MRKPASANFGKLSESLSMRLSVYASTAGAACAGMLGPSTCASAQVVYTPAHVSIESGTSYGLDIENDGNKDFVFTNQHSSSASIQVGKLFVLSSGNSLNGGGGWMGRLHAGDPSALSRGLPIGSSRYFRLASSSFPPELAHAFRFGSGFVGSGYFQNLKNRYLGVRFKANGEVHYGWARFTVHVNPNDCRISALLSGYAYESTPNKPIRAGQTSGTADDPVFAPEPEDPESDAGVRSEPEPISEAIPQAPSACSPWERRDYRFGDDRLRAS